MENKVIQLMDVIDILQKNKENIKEYDSFLNTILNASQEVAVESLGGEEAIQLYEQMYETLSSSKQALEEATQEIENLEQEVNKMTDENKEKQAELEKAAQEKQRLEDEAKKQEAQRQEEEKARAQEEAKRREIEAIQKKEMEQKNTELEDIKSRLQAIEQEKQKQLEQEHQNRVSSVVDKMLKGGVITQEEADEKVKSLTNLSESALMEVSEVIEKRLKTEPSARTVPPSEAKPQSGAHQSTSSQAPPVNKVEEAFAKLRALHAAGR